MSLEALIALGAVGSTLTSVLAIVVSVWLASASTARRQATMHAENRAETAALRAMIAPIVQWWNEERSRERRY